MNTEQKTTSQELSKALKRAGAKQESMIAVQIEDSLDRETVRKMEEGAIGVRFPETAASFDCPELMVALGDNVEVSRIKGEFYLARILYEAHFEDGDTTAEALGKLYLWRLENGHVKKEEE